MLSTFAWALTRPAGAIIEPFEEVDGRKPRRFIDFLTGVLYIRLRDLRLHSF